MSPKGSRLSLWGQMLCRILGQPTKAQERGDQRTRKGAGKEIPVESGMRLPGKPSLGERDGMEGRPGEKPSPEVHGLSFLICWAPHGPVSSSAHCFPLTWTKVQKTFTLLSPGLIPLLQLCDEFGFGKGNSYSKGKKPRGPWVSDLRGMAELSQQANAITQKGAGKQRVRKGSLSAEKWWLKGGGIPDLKAVH